MNKYKNQKTEVFGVTFASKREAARYVELRLAERAGRITALTVQPKYLLAPKVTLGGKLKQAMYYIADFCYRDEQDRLIVEDVKGVRTAVYRVKIHMLKHIHGIDVVEI